MASAGFSKYRRLEGRLWLTRWKHVGEESAVEDSLLELMDVVWAELTEGERKELHDERPRCWPFDSTTGTPDLIEVADAPSTWVYEGFRSATQTILTAGPA